MRRCPLFLLLAAVVIFGSACGSNVRGATLPSAGTDQFSTAAAAPRPAGTSVASLPTPIPPTAPAVAPLSPARSSSGIQPPAPSPAATTPESVGHAPPARLKIPRIGVDAVVEHVGVTADGNMDVPKTWENTAWYDQGPAPGNPGNAVIDGHLDSYTGPAVFARLRELKPGDDLAVVTESGEELHFTVVEVSSFPADAAPIGRLFGPEFTPHLNLITCEGNWDKARKAYDQRLIVFTRLATTP